MDYSQYTEEEAMLLRKHDESETLHAYVPNSTDEDEPDVFWAGLCEVCDDTAEGLMHNNTYRNVEPLMEGY